MTLAAVCPACFARITADLGGRVFDASGAAVASAQVELIDNATNVHTPGFAQPNGSFGSAALGSITATTTDPLVAQFALRLSR